MLKEQKRPVTLADLASQLKVSRTTVRKALEDLPGVGESTKVRIRNLADSLGYSPNLFARSLTKQGTGFVGLLLTRTIYEGWYSHVVDAITSRLKSNGYNVLLSLTHREADDEERECVEGLMGGHVGGIIAGPLLRYSDLKPFEKVLRWGPPLISFECIDDEMPISFVAIDHIAGMQQVVEHLVAKGHKKIAYICCPDEKPTPNTRRHGFEKALFDLDMPILGKNIIPGRANYETGYAKVKQLFEERSDDLPTALFCHSDECALGVLRALDDIGISVPGDVSLVGYDNLKSSQYSNPRITTVGGSIDQMAEKLSVMLIDTMEGRMKGYRHELITPKLIERDSVAAL